MKARDAQQRSRMARLLPLLAWAAVAALVLRTWYVQGLFAGLEVHGGSMAGTLVGVHHEVTCTDCRWQFDCSAEAPSAGRRAVCPNCGFAENDLASLPAVAGDRVLIHRSLYRIRQPQRWELVAFGHPQDVRRICVKRVVGLPGESVEIRDGDVYVGGRLARKNLVQQRALAVLVHDADFPATDTASPARHWKSDDARRWGASGGRFAHGWRPEDESIDWLTYHHGRRIPGSAAEVEEGPITNSLTYNRDRPLHPANEHPVRDVMVSFELTRLFGSGLLAVRATDGATEFRVMIDPTGGEYSLFQDDRPVESGAGLPDVLEGVEIEVSLVDRQFLLAADGRVVVCHPFDGPEGASQPPSSPLAVGSLGLGVEIRRLRVWRDVYYTRPLGTQGRWGFGDPVTLGGDGYYVLGDNSSISSDSRTWPDGPAVPMTLIHGKPVLVHYPARRIEWGRWHFQVPDPAEIRYIR